MATASPIIYTRDMLRKYIKRQLGWPVINVEIHDTQIDDAINQTIAEFIPYAYNGVEKRFVPLAIVGSQREFDMPYNVESVVGLYATDNVDFQATYSDMFSVNYYLANDILRGGVGKIDLVTIEMTQQFVETMGIIFGKRYSFDYNTITKKLFIDGVPKAIDGTAKVFMEYYRSIIYDPANSSETNYLYDSKWVQQYSSALARLQWGYNMMKYEGSVLPNGLVINSGAIREAGQAEIDSLKLQLHDEWELPVDFFVG